MITIREQQDLLLEIARKLKRKITVYAVGGTAMMFYGLKENTKDIDLVFTSENDREDFRKAAEEIGYSAIDSSGIYGGKPNQPEMLYRGKGREERFDFFLREIIYFIFSDNMIKRANDKYEFGENLILRIANPHDIILMKCATDRIKDKDDVKSIIESVKINWSILFEEAKNQIKLGKEMAAFELGAFLEDLKLKLKIDVPTKIIDDLFEIVKKQVKEKQEKIK